MHFFLFVTCPNNTSEFEALARIYNLLHDKVLYIRFMQNLGITFGPTVARRDTYACQVESNAEHCQVPWTQPLTKPLNMSFPDGG